MPTAFRLAEPFPIASVAALAHEISALERELEERSDAEFAPAARRSVSDRFMRATLFSPLGAFARAAAGKTPGSRATNTAIRLAVDFIRENHALHITSREISGASGANLRSLQIGFRDVLGTSVWQYLTMCRLENVRRNLCNPEFPSTVTDAAMLAGFTHLGEFGLQYKARYGETPSMTSRAAKKQRDRRVGPGGASITL